MRGNNPGYIQIARYIVGLSWIYHGFFPKLYHIAPLEKLMTGSAGFSAEVSDLITRSAGIGEIIFGVCLLGAVDLCSTYINQPTLVATS